MARKKRQQSSIEATKRHAKKVKGRVPSAGPPKKKKPASDSLNAAAQAIYQACQLHEDFKPLRWQGWEEYKKAIYDPDPE